MADMVGFWAVGNGAYLSPQSATEFLVTWPLMTAVDALLLGSYPALNDSYPWTNSDSAEFFAQASQYYHKIYPIFPSYDSQTILDCMLPWNTTCFDINAMSAFQLQTQYYQQQMIFSDRFGAKTFNQAEAHFLLSKNCAVKAVQIWIDAILSGDFDPNTAAMHTFEQVGIMFLLKQCQP
eukprot:TRINITY_DN5297_c0_g1_i2.p1 TRINITY_DN5297_c0_g1~~TRINITY_DN5297_c0_g1_i2.p1  ORF type:complete len:179 (+),score=20.46 TRINITY_DN5297_c0_g1_i2:517-1053(+)